MSEKSVATKLLIKPETTVWVSDPARMGLLGDLPPAVTRAGSLAGATTAILFVEDRATARALLEEHGDALKLPPYVWFLYPKGGRADINRDTLWPIVAEYGLRPITQVAVDETWSALRFRPLAGGEAPFTGGR